MKRYFLFYVLFCGIICAQQNKCDDLVLSGDYPKAIKCYEKLLKANKVDSTVAFIKIGDCYKALGEFKKAATYYSALVREDKKYVDAVKKLIEVAFIMGDTQTLQKYTLYAKIQFGESNKELITTLSNLEKMLQNIDADTIIEIKPLLDIQEDKDYISLYYKNDILFYVVPVEVGYFDYGPYWGSYDKHKNLFYKIKYIENLENGKRSKKSNILSPNIQGEYNASSISICETNNTIIIAKSWEYSSKEIPIKLFEIKIEGRENGSLFKVLEKNKKIKSFEEKILPFCKYDNYDYTGPTTSKNCDILIFSSNRSGVSYDLWITKKINSEWQEPHPIEGVNTTGNEIAPHLFNDSLLFFASNGYNGLGGYDIIKAKLKDQKAHQPEVLPYPINTPADEVAIFIKEEGKGYLLSNREKDMKIFSFSRIIKYKEVSIKGVFMLTPLTPLNEMRLKLLDENNNIVQTILTDSLGHFEFEKIQPDKPYRIELADLDVKLPSSAYIYIYNEKGEPVLKISPLEGKYFVLESLKREDLLKLKPLQESSSVISINMQGQVFKKILGDFSRKLPVLILNENDELIAVASTSQNGTFFLPKLPPLGKYKIRPISEDTLLKVMLYDKEGKPMELASKVDALSFLFTRIKREEKKIVLLDETGVQIEVQSEEAFKLPSIYYEYNKWDLLPESIVQLNKLLKILESNPHIGIELSSHTDSRGSNSFNKELSEKRAESAKQYLISHGISPDRIIAIGYGEEKLLNNCRDGVECSEEQHAVNRRTEFKILLMQDIRGKSKK